MRREDIEYDQKYGMIPDDSLERIKYILGKRANDEKFNQMIEREVKKYKRIKRIRITFTMWKVVKPSARPRVNSRGAYMRIYVPHAQENGAWFQNFFEENELPYIDTPCKIAMDVYEKTPDSFSTRKKVLAELGIIRPWKRTGDVDNYAKSILDCIQHGMLKDDCLVIESSQRLFYSIKPHCDVDITYMAKFPEF